MCYTETIKVNNLSQLVYLKVSHRVTLFLSKLSGIRPQVKFPGKWGLPLRYKLFYIWRYFTWDLLKTFHPLSHQHILRWYGDHNPVHNCVPANLSWGTWQLTAVCPDHSWFGLFFQSPPPLLDHHLSLSVGV